MTSKQVQIRRDSATTLNSSIPASGEVAADTTNKRLRYGDGTTPGGIPLPNFIDVQNQTMVAATAGGTADALTLTLSPAPTAYATLGRYVFKAASSNATTTPTLNVNGLGAKTIKKKTSSGKAAVAAGDIQSGCIYAAVYDGTDMQIESVHSTSGGVVDTQTFTSTGAGTWTKPSSGTIAIIRVWGGGGSGASRTTTGDAGGGGGGAYNELVIPLALLGATETVTVGAGGTGVSGNTQGNDGGNTTFGSWLTGYGGGKGVNTTASSCGSGGGGGGKLGAGAAGSAGANQNTSSDISSLGLGNAVAVGLDFEFNGGSGLGGAPHDNHQTLIIKDTINGNGTVSRKNTAVHGGGCGGYLAVGGNSSVYGGGGGGAGNGASTNGGGASEYGGGGGGGCSSTAGGTRTGGTSLVGGNGGDGGANTGGNGTAGTQPAGGGGGAVQGGTSGAGGAGKCIVYVI